MSNVSMHTVNISKESKKPDEYFSLVDLHLRELCHRPGMTYERLLLEAQGCFPTLIVERLQALGLLQYLPRNRHHGNTNEARKVVPELHPLDFEWYFSQECADELGRFLAEGAAPVLCLSAPTVACAAAKWGYQTVLMDRNPLVISRLPTDLPSLSIILSDLSTSTRLTGNFHTVFFDAPWYPEFISLWLWHASSVITAGGLIAFALFPNLVRPSANRERTAILEYASLFGTVEVIRDTLLYDTPLFEQEVLSQSGIEINRNWRRADLVVIRVKEPLNCQRPVVSYPDEQWDTFVLGQQVVKLRRFVQDKGDFIVSQIEECPDYLLPTVSRRDGRRKQVDIWTSRNRVAQVGRRDIVANILEQLAGNGKANLSEILRSLSLGNKERTDLSLSLRSILALQPEVVSDAAHSHP